MFLFSRVARLQGSPRDVMAWATKMTDFVNSNISNDTTLWQGLFGHPVGTVVWSSVVNGRAEFGEMMMTLMGNNGYHDLIDEGQPLFTTTPTEDHFRELVHGVPTDQEPPLGAAAQLITAVPAAGRLIEVMGWGPKVADMYAETTGAATAFFVDSDGDFGRVSWLILHNDLAAMDAAETAAMGSEAYLKEVDSAGQLFEPGQSTRGTVLRVG